MEHFRLLDQPRVQLWKEMVDVVCRVLVLLVVKEISKVHLSLVIVCVGNLIEVLVEEIEDAFVQGDQVVRHPDSLESLRLLGNISSLSVGLLDYYFLLSLLQSLDNARALQMPVLFGPVLRVVVLVQRHFGAGVQDLCEMEIHELRIDRWVHIVDLCLHGFKEVL